MTAQSGVGGGEATPQNSMINGTADLVPQPQAQQGDRQSVQESNQREQTPVGSGAIEPKGGESYGATREEPRPVGQQMDREQSISSASNQVLDGVESQLGQVGPNQRPTILAGDNTAGYGMDAAEAAVSSSAQPGYYTPRSNGSMASSRPQWIQGLELPGWVTRLGSYLSVPPRPELLPSPLAGSSTSTSPLRDRVVMMTQGGRRLVDRTQPPPSPPTSSSLPAEAIQAEVQRQLGDLLGRLQSVEQDRDRLKEELRRERTKPGATSWSPWVPSSGELRQGPALPGLVGVPSGDPPNLLRGGALFPSPTERLPDYAGSSHQPVFGEGQEPTRQPQASLHPQDTEPGEANGGGEYGQQSGGTSTTTMPVFGPGPSRTGAGEERSGLLRSILGPRVRTPSPPPPSRPSTESSILEVLTKGVQQLQELQAQALSKGESPQAIEVVKPGTVALPQMPELKKGDAAGSALKCQDWLEVSSSILADVSEHSGQWWEQVLQLVGSTYAKWLAATPLERLQITPVGEASLCSGRWIRVNARIASMLLASMGDELKADAVALRITQSVPRMVFRMYSMFQPGGSAERHDLLQRLQSPGDTMGSDSLEDTLRVLQAWPRWVARCISMKMSPPDPQVLARGLMSLTSHHINSSPDAAFRTSMLRTTLRLDAQPDLDQVISYQRHLQAELETMVNSGSMGMPSTTAPSSGPKVKAAEVTSPPRKDRSTDPCKYFAKPGGCKRGLKCGFSHSMAGMDRETRSRKCLQCGSESHRQKDCVVNKPRAPPTSSATSSPTTNRSDKATTSSSQAPSVAARQVSTTSGVGDQGVVPGVPWTLESLIQATQQFVQAQPTSNQDERPSSPEKTGATIKTVILKDLRVSGSATTTALLDSGATHSLRSARSQEEWQQGEKVMVQLAGDSQLQMKIGEGGSLLMPPLSHTGQKPSQTIVPLGELVKTLGYTLVWTPTKCILEDKNGHRIPLNTSTGCPQICEAEALAMIARLEERKLEQLENAALTTEDRISVAAMALQKSWFDRLMSYAAEGGHEAKEMGLRALRDAPFFRDVPGECLGGLVPDELPKGGWEAVKNVSFLSRPQRRRLLGAKRWIIHLFSGDPGHYEISKLDRGDAIVLQLDIRNSKAQDILSPSTWRMLMWGALHGRIDLVMGGPPGRAVSTWAKDGTTTNLRAQTLICRMLWLYSCSVAGRCARADYGGRSKQVGFVLEHPATLSSEVESENNHGGFWDSSLWRIFQEETGQIEVTFDQRAMGAERTSVTTLGTNVLYLKGIHGVGLEGEERIKGPQSSDYSVWSPGLVNALVVGLHLWAQSPRAYAMSSQQWKRHVDANHLPYRKDCVTCVMSKGTGRRHARVHHPDSFVLTSDLGGPIRPGLDSTSKGTIGKGIKYLLVAKYVFPKEYLKAYSGNEPPEDQGMPSQMEVKFGPEDSEIQNMFQEPPEEHRDHLPHGDEGVEPGQNNATLDHDLSDGDYEPTDMEEDLSDLDPAKQIRVQDPDQAKEDEPEQKQSTHPVMEWGDCEPPELSYLIFAVGLPNNKGATVKSALQDVALYLGSHGLPVYRFHADKGEFFNHSLREWLRAQGIRGTWGEPGIPQTNGRAEGTVRWVKDRIRTLLMSARLPTKLWPLAAEVAAAEQRSMMLGWRSLLAAPFGATVYIKKKPFKATGPRLRADAFESKWIKGKYMGLSGLLNRGHVVYVPAQEGETEAFLHTLHVRSDLVDPGEPELELRVDPAMKPRHKVVGKQSPDRIVMRKFEVDAREAIEKEANQLLMNWSDQKAMNFVASLAKSQAVVERKFGAFRHGGVVGLMQALTTSPNTTRVLAKLVRERAPTATFTAVWISNNTQLEMHRDSNNDAEALNYVLAIHEPRTGGELWVELEKGDVVQGEITEMVEKNGEKLYGQQLSLKEGECIEFSPRKRHAVQPWTGERLVLVGYTPQCLGKLNYDMIQILEDHEFLVPVSQLPETFLPRLAMKELRVEEEVECNKRDEEELQDEEEWKLYLDVKGSPVKVAGSRDDYDREPGPRVYKTEVTYTKDIEKVLKELQGPLDVVYNVNPAEVLNNLEKWLPSIKKEVDGIMVAVEKLLPNTPTRTAWLQRRGVQKLPTKFVFTVKPNDKADINDPATWFKRKARLVVCGNMATHSDSDLYTESAPAEAVRAALILSQRNMWDIAVLDIVAAFLKTPMGRSSRDPIVVVQPPKLLEKLQLTAPLELWGLVRALYGLKESPRLWGSFRDETLEKLEVRIHDSVLQMRRGKAVTAWWTVKDSSGATVAIVVVYVDDFLLCGKRDLVERLAKLIQSVWETSPLQFLEPMQQVRFLGMELTMADDGSRVVSLSQEGYINELLRAKQVGVTELSQIPLSKDLALFSVQPTDEAPNPESVLEAQKVAGEVLWLAQRTRPDLAFVSSVMSALTTKAPARVSTIGRKVMTYLQKTKSYRLQVNCDASGLTLFADSAFAPEGARSQTGWLVMFHGSALTWKSGRQPTVCLSTAECELLALTDGAVALLGAEAMLGDVGEVITSRALASDSTAALSITSGTGSWRTRHLRIKSAWLQERLESGFFQARHCPGRWQLADLLTKALSGQRIKDLLTLWGVTGWQGNESSPTTSGVGGSARVLVAIICCLMIMTAESKSVGQSTKQDLELHWDMVGWIMGLLAVVGCVAVWELLKWGAREVCDEWAPGAGSRKLRRLKKLRDATTLAIQQELDRVAGDQHRNSVATPDDQRVSQQATGGVETPRRQEARSSTDPSVRRIPPSPGAESTTSTTSAWADEITDAEEVFRVYKDMLMLLTVEEQKIGLRSEGLMTTGVKEELAGRLATRLMTVGQQGRVPPTVRQSKYALWLWRTKHLQGRCYLRYSDLCEKRSLSTWIGAWKER